MPGPPPLPEDGKKLGLRVFSLTLGVGYMMTLGLFGWVSPPFDTMYRDLNIPVSKQGILPLSLCLAMGAVIAALIFLKDLFATRRRAIGTNIFLLVMIPVIYTFWMILMMMPLWQIQPRVPRQKMKTKKLEGREESHWISRSDAERILIRKAGR